MNKKTENSILTRRNFLTTSATVSAGLVSGCASTRANTQSVNKNPDKIRVGLIGCGGRGTSAMRDCVRSSKNIELVAIGDVFQYRLDSAMNDRFGKWKEMAGKYNVPKERQFAGFDAYKSVLECDVDMVILGTPPHFRPEHLRASIAAGKHVFMEKPVAVDPVGIRSVIATAELAKQKGLGIVAGTQRRHDLGYNEVMKRIHDGQIGEVVGGECYWNQGFLWSHEQKPEWSDMEWQLRNWLYFTWLSGDHIVEQHVHNIDVINWAFQTHPVKATGMGGREVRKGKVFGNIFDHFAIDFEYPNGAHVLSMCRQIHGCSNKIAERVVGTKGISFPSGEIKGEKPYKYEVEKPLNPYILEHKDLIASIRAGNPLNEGKQVAISTMTAIMGRMVAYTGRAVKWDWVMNASKLDLTPPKYEFGPLPVAPISVPGKTRMV
jgi:myo-inositol 2-dehydrogenase / D-chiro-inositol 1-dehydrogenase